MKLQHCGRHMRDTQTIEIEVGNTSADVTLALDITDASFSHAFGIKKETDVELNEDATTIENFEQWNDDGDTISTTPTKKQAAALIEEAWQTADLAKYNN